MEPPLSNYSWQWQKLSDCTMHYIDSKKQTNKKNHKKAPHLNLLLFIILSLPCDTYTMYFCACTFLCHHHFLKMLTSSQFFSCICTHIHRIWLFFCFSPSSFQFINISLFMANSHPQQHSKIFSHLPEKIVLHKIVSMQSACQPSPSQACSETFPSAVTLP